MNRDKSMRWMFEKYLEYELYPETLCLAISIYDNYYSKKNDLQNDLVTFASFFLACKFEESDCPALTILFPNMDHEQIKEKEIVILEVLKYQIPYQTAMWYLNGFFIKKDDLYQQTCEEIINNLISFR